MEGDETERDGKELLFFMLGKKKNSIFFFTLMKHCAANNHSYLVNELSETKCDVRCCYFR